MVGHDAVAGISQFGEYVIENALARRHTGGGQGNAQRCPFVIVLRAHFRHGDLMLAVESILKTRHNPPFVLEGLGTVDHEFNLKYSEDHGGREGPREKGLGPRKTTALT